MAHIPDNLNEFIDTYLKCGFSLIWLAEKSKVPLERDWTRKPRKTREMLETSYRKGFNIAVRLGEHSYSSVFDGYLHGIDLDIRDTSYSDEALEALNNAFPGIDFDTLWTVKSGSGGPSVHYYFYAKSLFATRKIAKSDVLIVGEDGKKHAAWEIDLAGTGKQFVLPPSIHPDTGNPYRWLNAPDLDLIDLGFADAPFISDDLLEQYSDAEVTEGGKSAVRAPLEYAPGQLERELKELPVSFLDDYNQVVMLGQALHHQTEGSEEGYRLWLETRKRSERWQDGVGNNGEREWRRKWAKFGKNEGRRRIVTMATVRAWYMDSVRDRLLARMDEELDDDDLFDESGSTDSDDDDLFGETPPVEKKKKKRPATLSQCFPRTRSREEALIDMNIRYAAVSLNGKFRVVAFDGKGRLVIYTKDDLLAYELANNIESVETDDDGNEKTAVINVPRTWLSSGLRRTYNGLEFRPDRPPAKFDDPPGIALNMFTGFALKPSEKTACPIILEFIENIICASDPVLYSYVIRWCAHLLQRPGEKPGVALVMRSDEGTGKGSFMSILSRIIGRAHTKKLTQTDHLTGRFNSFLEVALLVCADEAFWAGSKAAEGPLKANITETELEIERKGLDPFTIDNFSRFIFATNNDWAVPASINARRWCVTDVSESRMGDFAYYERLRTAIDGDECRQFMQYLLKLDLTGFNVRSVPATKALAGQKLQTMEGHVEGIWLEILKEGSLPSIGGGIDDENADWTTGEVRIPKNALVAEINRRAREDHNRRRVFSDSTIGTVLKKMIPEVVTVRSGSNPRQYVLPSLQECRDNFDTFIKTKIAWDE